MNKAFFLLVIIIFLIALINPTLAFFMVIGYGLGFTIRLIISTWQRSTKFRYFLTFVLGVFTCCITIFLLSFFRVIAIEFLKGHVDAAPPLTAEFHYLASIQYESQIDSWLIDEELSVIPEAWSIYDPNVVASDSLNAGSIDSTAAIVNDIIREMLQSNADDSQDDFQQLADSLKIDGWTFSVLRKGNPSYIRKRQLKANYSWISAYRVNSIPMLYTYRPEIYYSIDDASELILTIPKKLISKTYPSPKSREDFLSQNLERITIPIEFSQYDDDWSLRIEIINPLLRNDLGIAMIETSLWTPLKWILLSICAIFAEQIKKSLLIPVAKRIFKVLRIPFKNK